MTRTYIAKRLLEHGALTRKQFIEITGWPPRAADSALSSLVRTKVAVHRAGRGHRGLSFQLARGAEA